MNIKRACVTRTGANGVVLHDLKGLPLGGAGCFGCLFVSGSVSRESLRACRRTGDTVIRFCISVDEGYQLVVVKLLYIAGCERATRELFERERRQCIDSLLSCGSNRDSLEGVLH